MSPPTRLWIAALALVLPLAGPLAAQPAAAPDPAASPAAAPGPDEGPQPIAVVNGEPILPEEIEGWLTRIHGEVEAGSRGDFDVQRLIDRVIDERLLAQEARALEMDSEQPVSGFVEQYRRSLLRDRLERREVLERVAPTEEELRREFGLQYRTVDMTVITVDEQAYAQELRERVEAGAEMAALARRESVDPYGPRGGRVSGVARADLLREIAELAFALSPGELGGPVRTDLGWSILRVDGFAEPAPESFEQVRGPLANLIRARKSGRLRAELAERLRRDHPVRLDDERIASIRPGRLPDGRLAPNVPDRSAVVVKIGERHSITAGQLADALLLRWSGVRSEEAAAASVPMVVERLVEEGLMVAEAEKTYKTGTPEIEAQVRAYETRLLAQRYRQELVAAAVVVTDEEVRAYYDDNLERFARPPRVHLRQITVTTAEEAERIAKLLREGADPAWLARQHSVDRFRDRGGDRGWAAAGPGPDALSAQLVSASPGDVIGPLGALNDHKVYKVTAREPQGTIAFEEVAATIRAGLQGERIEAARAALVQKLRDRSEIVVDSTLLRSLRISGSDTAER